jgi:2-methylisocitrate lyase-like PEP mutase family enzyme
MFVAEGAEILLLDSPKDLDEIRRAVKAADGRHSFSVLSPGAPRVTPSAKEAAALGYKIGTFPTAMLSPAVGAIQAGLNALNAGQSAADSAIAPAELSTLLGYADYEEQAQRFALPD